MSPLQTDGDVDVLEELASLPSFFHQTVSPDGSKVAYYTPKEYPCLITAPPND